MGEASGIQSIAFPVTVILPDVEDDMRERLWECPQDTHLHRLGGNVCIVYGNRSVAESSSDQPAERPLVCLGPGNGIHVWGIEHLVAILHHVQPCTSAIIRCRSHCKLMQLPAVVSIAQRAGRLFLARRP